MDEKIQTDVTECPVCKRRKQEELAHLKASHHRLTQRCIMVSQCLNNLRIIPRIIVAAYGYLVYVMVAWFMSLTEPTTQQAALVTTICGMAPIITAFYMQGGTSGKAKD